MAEDVEICFVDKSDYKEVSTQSDTGAKTTVAKESSVLLYTRITCCANIGVQVSNESSLEYGEYLSKED